MKNIVFSLSLITIFFLSACNNTQKQGNNQKLEPTSEKNNANELQGWELCESIVENLQEPQFPDKEFNINDFGAIADGTTLSTDAIAKAITTCNEQGGGKVIIPAGTYLTGAVHLKSNVNLHISEGATLLFTTDKSKYLPVVHTRFEGMECYNYSPFIYAYKQENIAITGTGTIDGQGSSWWDWKGKWSGSVDIKQGENVDTQKEDIKHLTKMVADHAPLEDRVFGEGHFLRPNFVQPYLCKNVLIEDISIKGSPMWIVHPVLSENVIVRGIKIESLGLNNDGCNPECCKNVLIEDCYFNTGDDCIAIKSGRNEDGRRIGVPSENIIVRGCTMIEGHGGVVMGSEISGNVRNVFAMNCVMNSPNLDRAIRIKSNTLRGGIVENVYVKNIEVKQVKEAVLKINMHYAKGRGNNTPTVRNIYLEGVKSHKSKHAVWIKAMKEIPVTNLNIIDCDFQNADKDDVIENVDGVTIKNTLRNGELINEL